MGLNSLEREVKISYNEYADPKKVSEANPLGMVRWTQLNFITLGLSCEISSRTHKELVKLFYNRKLYVNGELNTANVEKFVKESGSPFSINRPPNSVDVILD